MCINKIAYRFVMLGCRNSKTLTIQFIELSNGATFKNLLATRNKSSTVCSFLPSLENLSYIFRNVGDKKLLDKILKILETKIELIHVYMLQTATNLIINSYL